MGACWARDLHVGGGWAGDLRVGACWAGDLHVGACWSGDPPLCGGMLSQGPPRDPPPCGGVLCQGPPSMWEHVELGTALGSHVFTWRGVPGSACFHVEGVPGSACFRMGVPGSTYYGIRYVYIIKKNIYHIYMVIQITKVVHNKLWLERSTIPNATTLLCLIDL